MIISSKVPHVYAGYTIEDYLAHRFTYLTKEQWQQRISEGRILCNTIPVSIYAILNTNDVVSYDMPDFAEPPADLGYRIVFEDDWLLGIDKPGNLLVHHHGRSFRSNLIYHLRYLHNPPFEQSGIVSRLDRETSGVVMAAKNKDALRAMNRIVAGRKIKKEYWAIVHGVLQNDSGVIDFPIGIQTGSKIKYRHCINGDDAKDAVTRYKTIERLKDSFSLVRLFPETGRTHQLRVHLAAIGHPIAGDKLYGMSDDEFMQWREEPGGYDKNALFKRHALHCLGVNFIHPFTGAGCSICAPLPDDMKNIIHSFK